MNTCLLCGNTYTTPVNVTQKKYCSATCTKKAWKVNNREKYLSQQREQNKRHWQKVRKEPADKYCNRCGKQFLPSRINVKYCSTECSTYQWRADNRAKVLMSKRKERIKNRERYRKWNQGYKDRVRFDGNQRAAMARDGFQCQDCSKKYPDVELVVHHLDGNGMSKPEEERNHELDNLQTLCRGCHARKHSRWRRL